MPFSLINPSKLTPIQMLLASCGAWLLFYFAAPIDIYRAASAYPYVILGACIVGLLVGLAVFEPRRVTPTVVDRDEMRRTLRQLYEIAFILGAVGIALRTADWVFLRGLSIDTDFINNREKIESAGSNAFAMASTVLVPFSLVPYMIHAVSKRNGERVGRAWQAIALATLWPILTIVIGSRSSMFMSLGMLIVSRLVIYPRTSRKVLAFCALLVLGLIYAGGLIFIERLTLIGLNIEGVMRLSAFTKLAPVTQEYYTIAAGLSDWGRDTMFIITTFIQYYVHGVPEFTYLVEHYAKPDQFGTYTFTVLDRLAYTIWGTPFDGNASLFLMPRVGIYTTMFGPFYIDFGPFTPAFCFVLGAGISWTRRCVLLGEIAALPLYICLVMQVASAIVINSIQSAYGIFYDLAFIGLWAGYALLRRRPARSNDPAAA